MSEVTTASSSNSFIVEWKEIQINDTLYFISASKKDATWSIMLTNLKDLWKETLTEEQLLQKSKKLNFLIDFEDFDYRMIINDMFSDIPKYVQEATSTQIKLRFNFDEDIFFKFALELSKCDSNEFWEYITKPIYISSMQLLCQHNILINLIKNKDAEIAEYKAQGAELIRKNIESKPFNQNTLKVTLDKSSDINYNNAFQSIVTFYNSMKESKASQDSKRQENSQMQDEQLKTKGKGSTPSKMKGKVLKSKLKPTSIIIPESLKNKKSLNKFIL